MPLTLARALSKSIYILPVCVSLSNLPFSPTILLSLRLFPLSLSSSPLYQSPSSHLSLSVYPFLFLRLPLCFPSLPISFLSLPPSLSAPPFSSTSHLLPLSVTPSSLFFIIQYFSNSTLFKIEYLNSSVNQRPLKGRHQN